MLKLEKDFKSTQDTVTRIISKKETQSLLSDLRKTDNIVVTKVENGYTVHHVNPKDGIQNRLLFKAMNGKNGYLCRFDTRLFE